MTDSIDGRNCRSGTRYGVSGTKPPSDEGGVKTKGFDGGRENTKLKPSEADSILKGGTTERASIGRKTDARLSEVRDDDVIYTKLTKKAYKIAFDAHRDQVDKTGLPYIHHPLHVASQMTDEIACCVALLHDVVEDSDITFEDLQAEGFPDEVIAALRLLTHDDDVPYMDYVAAVKGNPVAAAVKMADLRHNSDMTRLDTVTEWDIARAEKYKQAMALLEA